MEAATTFVALTVLWVGPPGRQVAISLHVTFPPSELELFPEGHLQTGGMGGKMAGVLQCK